MAEAAGHELTIRRVFDAPQDLVLQMWADPRNLGAWWGPRGFVAVAVDMDVAPGGSWRTCIRPQDDDATEYWCSGRYQEVSPPDRLVFTFAWEQPPGTRGHETVVTVTFAAVGDRTEMVFHQTPFETTEDRDEHESGWAEAFDDLTLHLTDVMWEGEPT